MSAYVVGREHIDALVRLGLEGPSGYHGGPGGRWSRPFSWYVFGPQPDPETWPEAERRELHPENADEIGRMLWMENVRSIEYRYPDTAESGTGYPGPIGFDHEEAATYTYTRRLPHLTAGQGLLAIRGLDYQSCEHPQWRTSAAKQYLDTLADRLVNTLPEVREADTWEVVG